MLIFSSHQLTLEITVVSRAQDASGNLCRNTFVGLYEYVVPKGLEHPVRNALTACEVV
jgi:hypothetical protein